MYIHQFYMYSLILYVFNILYAFNILICIQQFYMYPMFLYVLNIFICSMFNLRVNTVTNLFSMIFCLSCPRSREIIEYE